MTELNEDNIDGRLTVSAQKDMVETASQAGERQGFGPGCSDAVIDPEAIARRAR